MRTARIYLGRLLGAFVAVVLVVRLGGLGTAHAAEPDPYPATGGSASAWTCTTATVDDPDPEAPADATLLKQTCKVTSWAADPAPPEAETSTVTGNVRATVDPEQWSTLAGGLILLVLLGAAIMTAQLRRR